MEKGSFGSGHAHAWERTLPAQTESEGLEEGIMPSGMERISSMRTSDGQGSPREGRGSEGGQNHSAARSVDVFDLRPEAG
jgi:hypothetical protein